MLLHTRYEAFSMINNFCTYFFIKFLMYWLFCVNVVGLIRDEPSISISLIQEKLNKMVGYAVSRKKVWKAKQIALANVFGEWEESYNKLPL